MKELIFATYNENKALEIQGILGDDFRVLTLRQAGFEEELSEERDTLEGNALQKAEIIFKRFGKDCFADDTGLEVRALNGEPGVFSARYAEMSGEKMPGETESEANIRKLLRQMDGVRGREARFRTVIALIVNGEKNTFEGLIEGRILLHPRGSDGFGYDPVFQPDGYHKSFAEMSLQEKNRISHRSRAVQKLVEFLKISGRE